MFVLTDGNTTVVQYPYSFRDLRRDNPNVSFPSEIPADWDGSDFNFFPVVETPEPAPSSPDVVVEESIEFVDPDWVQNWIERAPTAGELAIARATKRGLCREVFVSKVDAAALAAGFSQDNLDLIEATSAFSASVLSFLFANSSQPFRDNVAACRTTLQSKLSAIDAATTLSEIDAVDENAGWPV